MNKPKEKILLTAVDLFNERGFANVLKQDIAKEANISLSNINYHFATKKDLVYGVFKFLKVVLEEKIAEAIAITNKGVALEVLKICA